MYLAGFLARCDHLRRAGQTKVEEPGIHGLLGTPDDPHIRLLVTDDRAHDTLAAILPNTTAGMISVFAEAERCSGLVGRCRTWRAHAATAMSCGDLRAVPALPLPGGLKLQPVRRLPADPADGVRLEDAVTAAIKAAPGIGDPPQVFADYLRSLPASFRLFAGVDRDGAVRATSASGTFGTEATVIFVNTDPEWRGRGIGHAMTAAALRAARDAGALRAGLDASDAGSRIYLRLGFEAVTQTARFFHTH